MTFIYHSLEGNGLALLREVKNQRQTQSVVVNEGVLFLKWLPLKFSKL